MLWVAVWNLVLVAHRWMAGFKAQLSIVQSGKSGPGISRISEEFMMELPDCANEQDKRVVGLACDLSSTKVAVPQVDLFSGDEVPGVLPSRWVTHDSEADPFGLDTEALSSLVLMRLLY